VRKKRVIEEQEKGWLYGINPVIEALKAGSKIEVIYVSSTRYESQAIKEIRKKAEEMALPLKIKDADFFNKNFPKGHQGIVARIVEKEFINLEKLLKIPSQRQEAAFFILLDCIEDPRNFGAIIRAAEAGGVHGIIIQTHRTAGFGPTVYKTSAGAVEYMAVTRVSNIKYAIERLKEEGVWIYGADVEGEDTLWNVDFKKPTAVVFGSEGAGLRKTIQKRCDCLIKIPLRGQINSLNVSVAAGILIYEVFRQRYSIK